MDESERSKGAAMTGFELNDDELAAVIEIAGTLDRIAAKLESAGMDSVRARTVGTFYMAIKNLVEQREENDKIRRDLDTAVFNILTGMQTLVTESHKFSLVLEAVQTLTAEVQRQNDIFELLAKSRWIGLSNEYGVMDKGLQDLNLKKQNNK